jgi:hypothetical protein
MGDPRRRVVTVHRAAVFGRAISDRAVAECRGIDVGTENPAAAGSGKTVPDCQAVNPAVVCCDYYPALVFSIQDGLMLSDTSNTPVRRIEPPIEVHPGILREGSFAFVHIIPLRNKHSVPIHKTGIPNHIECIGQALPRICRASTPGAVRAGGSAHIPNLLVLAKVNLSGYRLRGKRI